ncbi:MAG: polymer-forming cytoskeletal protein [Alphaproteobacteria bacterium]
MFGDHTKPGSQLGKNRGKPTGPIPVAPRPRFPSTLRPNEARATEPARGPVAPAPDNAANRGAEPVPFDPRRDEKRLIVGKGIVMKGEVSACDRLVVEGRVEASLGDSDVMVITEGGEFKGTAEINEADVSGAFEGTLTVAGRLMVRAKGRVSGDIRYGELEVERGGRVIGQVQIDAENGDGGEGASTGKST